jgi:rhomboid family GlyGly-CTERM serine protease
MKSSIRRIAKRFPIVTLLLTAASLAVHFFHPIRPYLLYTRSELLNGEFWRLAACHWVHLNTDHLQWSALTFLLLGSICEVIDRKRYAATVGLSTLFIPALIWTGAPHLQIYGGLSGLDCAFYALLIVLMMKLEKEKKKPIWIVFYAAMLLLLPAKIVFEMTSGMTIFVNNSHTDMVPVPLSHLAGGIVGFLIGLTKFVKNKPSALAALDLRIADTACK